MSDIVERLRDARNWLNNGYCCGQKDSDDTCAAPACLFGESLKEFYAAADEIERLRDLVQLAFGLLWADRPNEARRHLSDALTQEQKGKGIAAARAGQKYASDETPIPSPVAKAIEALEYAAKDYQWRADDTDDHGWIKYSAAAVMLRHWAAGLGKDDT